MWSPSLSKFMRLRDPYAVPWTVPGEPGSLDSMTSTRLPWPHTSALAALALSLVISATSLALPRETASAETADNERPASLSDRRPQRSALPSFHVRLGLSHRANCIASDGKPRQRVLRCDRYQFGKGQELSVQIVRGRASRPADPSDATGDPIGPRLRAGKTWREGRFECRATQRAVRCQDLRTDHGFRLKAHRLIIF